VCVDTLTGEVIDISYAQKAGNKPIPEGRILRLLNLTSQTGTAQSCRVIEFYGQRFTPGGTRGWSVSRKRFERLKEAGLVHSVGKSLTWKYYRDWFPFRLVTNVWTDLRSSGWMVVEILGVDVYNPKTGEIRSSDTDDIALWMVDTDYDAESFFRSPLLLRGTRRQAGRSRPVQAAQDGVEGRHRRIGLGNTVFNAVAPVRQAGDRGRSQ
jgi:hypothetical protein